jgi:hypothetical protein
MAFLLTVLLVQAIEWDKLLCHVEEVLTIFEKWMLPLQHRESRIAGREHGVYATNSGTRVSLL